MSLEKQLKEVKLKKTQGMIKDYSDPKLAGFMSEDDVIDYQNKVLDVNTEIWMDALVMNGLTFPTKYCPISIDEAKLFIKIYEKNFKDKDQETFKSTQWLSSLSQEENNTIEQMISRLQATMDEYISADGYVFVKTSSRSAKDAPMYQEQFIELYKTELKQVKEEDRTLENTKITCLLKAAFQAMKLSSAKEVINTFVTSERIYQDMLLATKVEDRFQENFVVRKFIEIDVDLEFRGFVYNGELHAICQYNYLIYSERLDKSKASYQSFLCTYFNAEVRTTLEKIDFVKNYVIDFAICLSSLPGGGRSLQLWVIEINPFMETTDGGLFSWQHERHLLEGKEGFQFRITERPKPGAKTMLPQSVRTIMQSVTI